MVLVPEADAVSVHVCQAGIAQGHPVGVAGQALQHPLRTAEGRLGVHDPLPGPERGELGREVARIGQRRQPTRQLTYVSMVRGGVVAQAQVVDQALPEGVMGGWAFSIVRDMELRAPDADADWKGKNGQKRTVKRAVTLMRER